jgi:hypothetical protein
MPAEIAALTKRIRAEVIRRPIDTSQLFIAVSGHHVHFTGVLRPLRAYANVDMQKEKEHIEQALRLRCGISDVSWDVSIRT